MTIYHGDYNRNYKQSLVAVNKYNLTLNSDTCLFGVESIKLLGYTVRKGSMRPDHERLKLLQKVSIPGNMLS